MQRSSGLSFPIQMNARRLPLPAIMLESAGFLIVICAIWLDELIDLPHYLFNAPISPFRLEEALLESSLALVLGAIIVGYTMRLVRHLESLIVLCAWCRRVGTDGAWVSVEDFLLLHHAETSHGICPECAAQLLSERTS
jgi:hypothetical protein